MIQPPGTQPQRFVVSYLRSRQPDRDRKRRAGDTFAESFQRSLQPLVDVLSAPPQGVGCRATLVQGEWADMVAKAREMPPDTVIEPEQVRTPAVAQPLAQLQGPGPQDAAQAGRGARLKLKLTSGDAPARGATVKLYLQRRAAWPLPTPTQPLSLEATSDESGQVAFEHDPSSWVPLLAVIEARDAWSLVVYAPSQQLTVNLPRLPRTGPLGWWHVLAGLTHYSASRGEGIRIGVADTGVGPHPYLSHVQPLGAFLNGSFESGPEAARDVSVHGTHVSGLIGARPPEGSGDYAGLVPGAQLLMARLFNPQLSTSQADVANAMDALADEQVDLINLSLGGPTPSAIEQDAVLEALQQGTLCICAAGNGYGAPASYPAAYPQCVSISALGLLGALPRYSEASLYLPTTWDRYTWQGLFLGSFSNVGPRIDGTAPGVALISTVPPTAHHPAPYADLSGTSMAAPLATAALAATLAENEQYRRMPRGQERALYARSLLARTQVSLGLSPFYQGLGLVRG
jgi:subtilisin family serine protease